MSLDYSERKILEALNDLPLPIEQLQKQTGISEGLSRIARGLTERGLVEEHIRGGRKVWKITSAGRGTAQVLAATGPP